MPIKINEDLLDIRLATVEKAEPWSPRLISKLEALIRSEDPSELYRVDPLEFASEKNVSESEAINLFLQCSKEGVFELNWHLTCPLCGGMLESFHTLKMVHSGFNCEMCQLEGNVSLDDYIQISFTIVAEIRAIPCHDVSTLSIEDYFRYHYFNRRAIFGPTDEKIRDSGNKMVRGMKYIEPRTTEEFLFDVQDDHLVAYDAFGKQGYKQFVSGPPALKEQSVVLSFHAGKVTIEPTTIQSGKVRMRVENQTDKRSAFILIVHGTAKDEAPIRFAPFLSGKRLLTTQKFRDLYRWDTIEADEGIAIKDLTLIFTDLKGSTALYDRIGDLRAYALVRQHFDSLSKVITRNQGSTVKTIGDAVMAAFTNPRDALKAAGEMLTEIEDFNKHSAQREIILKIGIHKGAAIAVTLNDRLDYFGQSVNIAARIQNLADADEIWITNTVYEYSGMNETLEKFEVQAETAKLKGVSEEMQVYRLTLKHR